MTVKTEDVLEKESLAVDVCDKKFRLKVKVGTWIYFLVQDLTHQVYLDCNGESRPSTSAQLLVVQC